MLNISLRETLKSEKIDTLFQGETGAFSGAERGSFVSAASETRDYKS